MNRLRSYVWMVCLLCVSALAGSCSREVVSTPDGGPDASGSGAEAGSLRIVLSTPSPDAVVNPGSRADGETAAALHEVQEWTVKKLGVYIFMASTQSAGDADYRLVKKKEGITFGAAGTPGVSGTAMGNGEYSYTEMLEKYMIGNYLKVLLVANEGELSGITLDTNHDGTSGTTLQDFKALTAGAVLNDSEGQSADKISGGAYTSETDLTGGTYTGIVMSGTARKGTAEEIHLASAALLELEAQLTRNVARIDICLNKKGLTLKKAVLKTTAKQAYLFPQETTAAPDDALLTAYPLTKKGLKGRTGILLFILFTMLFSGGLIPFYLLIQDLHLMNDDLPWLSLHRFAFPRQFIQLFPAYFYSRIHGRDLLRFPQK